MLKPALFVLSAVDVQRVVGAAQGFDLVDRVQHRGVMPVAKLAANFV